MNYEQLSSVWWHVLRILLAFFGDLKPKANSVLSYVCGQCEITSAHLVVFFLSFFFSHLMEQQGSPTYWQAARSAFVTL